eukprot:350100-Chlamydomonas_euryale.AAC.1
MGGRGRVWTDVCIPARTNFRGGWCPRRTALACRAVHAGFARLMDAADAIRQPVWRNQGTERSWPVRSCNEPVAAPRSGSRSLQGQVCYRRQAAGSAGRPRLPAPQIPNAWALQNGMSSENTAAVYVS